MTEVSTFNVSVLPAVQAAAAAAAAAATASPAAVACEVDCGVRVAAITPLLVG